jgi:two-component system chemotaxis sensor kinase CheA
MIECGTLGAGEQLSREQLFERMLAGGVSTSREVTQISGRGIGLDAIRETAQQLEGKVSLESEAGRGTKVSFDVPISLASLPALLVECCGMTVAIPLEAVLEARRFAQEDIQRSAQSTSVDIDGKIVPFLPLARALRGEEGRATKKTVSAVVLRSEGKLGAFGVDALYGTADIVVRPLPQGLAAESTVVGMSLDAGGHPRLVLDPTALISSMSVERQSQQEARPHRAPVLVIDDSLTTRMLEQSILESAGYLVELATSGEQGIEKARTNTYSIFLVDVDMPGMSGFEFVEKTRADPDLCKIPAILVTSRNSVEDFERGRKVGAGDYVVKGEFDQSRLLQSIERLLRS